MQAVMRSVIASRRLGPIALILLGAACSTRVVDLPLGEDGARGIPADAAANVKPNTGTDPGGSIKPSTGADAGTRVAPDAPLSCEMVRRSDGAVCKLCFAPDGTVVNGTCEPVAMTVPPPPADAAPAIPVCKIIPRDDLRCRVCSAAAGDYTACLTCQEPVLLGGERCRPCVWSDLPEQRCLQCFGADGGVSHDDCDQFRKEVVAAGGV
jgi:hypothetical protein